MDAAKWPQGFQDHTNLVKPMEDMISNSCNNRPPTMEKKAKPPEQLNCPRCNSTNTKFCYYNNYSLTQPRYFCKTCRRYWTEGGSLRNVPVGGGSRKNKRSSSSSTTSTHKIPDLNPQLFPSQNPKDISTSISTPKGQDLNLAFPSMHEGSHGNFSQFLHGSKIEHHHNSSNTLQHSSSSSPSFSPAFELLRSDGMGSFVPNSSVPGLFPSGFPMQDYKPSLSFSIDGFGNRNPNGVQDNGGRVFFPFGGDQMKSTNSGEMEQNKGQGNNNNNNSSSGYWNNGVLGGGSWQ